ncbi:MAG: hypothetical protein KQJ78_23155 [Deltaproteobacteria bacterium]|nr:hypothetical protein [Deltaproteobacteria bacterium]
MPNKTKGRDRAATTVYLSQAGPEATWLSRHGAPRSEQLRDDLTVLRTLAGRVPELSEAEAKCLRDILNATRLDAGMVRYWPGILAQAVRDSGPDGLAEKWGVDLEALAVRLEALHPADAWALWESVRAWLEKQ